MRKHHAVFHERAYLRRGGHLRLDRVFGECARLYNAALEHWQTAYPYGHSVTLYEQFRDLTTIRSEDEFRGSVGLGLGWGVLCRIERARQPFYRRCKNDGKPGYPKYRASRRWKTIEIDDPTPGMVTNMRGKWVVKARGLPILFLRPKHGLPDPKMLKTLTITRKPSGVYVSLGFEVEKETLLTTGRSVGLDMGVSSRIALSDGTFDGRRETGRGCAAEDAEPPAGDRHDQRYRIPPGRHRGDRISRCLGRGTRRDSALLGDARTVPGSTDSGPSGSQSSQLPASAK